MLHGSRSQARWKEDGELLSIAERDGFDVFVTLDRGLQYQQNLAKRNLAVIIIHAKSNRFVDVAPFAPACLAKLRTVQPCDLVIIE